MVEDDRYSERAWRLRIGKIAPTVWDCGREFRRMLPCGVDLAVVTLGAREFSKRDLSEAREKRRAAARTLDGQGVDCIIAGGGPVATVSGVDAEMRFVSELRAELDAPFTTSIHAQIDAIRAIGAESIVAVTPFPAERDAEMRAYIERHGVEVVAIGGISVPRTADTRALAPHVAYRATRELLARVDREFDAVYVPCVPFGAVESIRHIETDTGHSVVMSAQAQIWKALKLGGIVPEIDRYGRLFDTLAA